MKRREFLSSAIGLTGSLAPMLAFGRTAPCPPGVVSVNRGNPVRTACSAATFSEVAEAPQWVNELPVNSGWQPIAGGPEWPGLLPWQRGDRIDDVKATPIDIKGFRAGIQDVIKPWCGGAYNPDRKELLLVANGGAAATLETRPTRSSSAGTSPGGGGWSTARPMRTWTWMTIPGRTGRVPRRRAI